MPDARVSVQPMMWCRHMAVVMPTMPVVMVVMVVMAVVAIS